MEGFLKKRQKISIRLGREKISFDKLLQKKSKSLDYEILD